MKKMSKLNHKYSSNSKSAKVPHHKKRMLRTITAALCLTALLAGCTGKAIRSVSSVSPNLELAQTDVHTITVPDGVQVVGLGEASHGVKEYQEMKADVFKALVQNNGCRTFIIEGDFGNALKVDDYIHGGEGTAKDAAALIGFRIYRTKEMEELLDWMRAYNETAAKGEDLHFYGMDMQQADGSKEYLFGILEQIEPEVSAAYEESFAFLNDHDMHDISGDAFLQGMTDAEKLIQEVDAVENRIVEMFGNETFAFARECASSLYKCCDIRKSDNEYNQVRDAYMAEKVHWFLEHGDGSVLFINGHNGHIGVNATPYYDCLGKYLREELGDRYFAIGTDARVTVFNSQTDEGFEKKTAKIKNDINALADKMEGNRYYIDFSAAAKDDGFHQILSKQQRITTINVTGVLLLKMFYTVKIIPQDTFDGMIVFDQVSPTTLN